MSHHKSIATNTRFATSLPPLYELVRHVPPRQRSDAIFETHSLHFRDLPPTPPKLPTVTDKERKRILARSSLADMRTQRESSDERDQNSLELGHGGLALISE
uniref:Uncharacterized protein n=1 Tax=Fagus sylvatica TaxID=28930 RepID=A0A2N9J0H7_FAGSY